MKKQIAFIFILIGNWSCESEPKAVDTIGRPDVKEPVIITDSLLFSMKDIDSIWLQSDFDSAIAVILNGNRKIMYDVSEMDKMYAASSKRKLNKKQLTAISENLSGKNQKSYKPSDCFQPYHGLLFYKKGKITGRFAICFSCGTYFSKPRNCGRVNYELTKQIFIESGLPVYDWNDSTQVYTNKITYSDFF